jgi:hypothetical protein
LWRKKVKTVLQTKHPTHLQRSLTVSNITFLQQHVGMAYNGRKGPPIRHHFIKAVQTLTRGDTLTPGRGLLASRDNPMAVHITGPERPCQPHRPSPREPLLAPVTHAGPAGSNELKSPKTAPSGSSTLINHMLLQEKQCTCNDSCHSKKYASPLPCTRRYTPLHEVCQSACSAWPCNTSHRGWLGTTTMHSCKIG